MTLYCGQRTTVKVNKAFHGRHITNETDCAFLEDDCTEEHPVTLYDWQVRLSEIVVTDFDAKKLGLSVALQMFLQFFFTFYLLNSTSFDAAHTAANIAKSRRRYCFWIEPLT